ncbi:MAG: phosphate signaling complex protein PhoU [Verrucomicrobia bacterium]|nr:phosphate signaling complex protein PhoU [Verrucomicrobiota bacterium]
MGTHYEQSMQRDIDRIKSKVTEMARLAGDSLDACLRALVNKDRQLAYSVILRDRRIDELEKEIDRLCLEFLVRQQPVAKHLRFAYVTIKINQEVERIGDYAESIARQIVKLSGQNLEIPIERYKEIAAMSIPMFRDAVKAYLAEDASLAERSMEVEEEVDRLKSVINAELVQLRQADKIPLSALTPLMTIARRFERVSDQAKNICEETLYFVTGQYQKHPGGEVWRVVFVDQHNSCRSQMAEAIAQSLSQPKFVFDSAGVDPKPVDPGAVEFLSGKGIDISKASSRSVEKLPNLEFTQIVILLDPAARKALPSGTKAVTLDWSIPDPSLVQGTPAERQAAYQRAHDFLHEHTNDLIEAILADKID